MTDRVLLGSLILGVSIILTGILVVYFGEYQSCVRGSMAIDNKPNTDGWRSAYQRECALKRADDPLIDHATK